MSHRDSSGGCGKQIAIAAAIVGMVLPVLAFFGIREFSDLFSLREPRPWASPTVRTGTPDIPLATATPAGIRNPSEPIPVVY